MKLRLPAPSITSEKGLAVPCRLIRNHAAFLNQLLHLDAADLRVQGSGMSMFHRTAFGVFFSVGRDRHLLTDPVSGLCIDPACLRDIYWLPARDRRPASFILQFQNEVCPIVIHPVVESAAGRRALERVVDSFHERKAMAASPSSEITDAWLDEWRPDEHIIRRSGGTSRLQLQQAAREGWRVQAMVADIGWIASLSMTAAFSDFDGGSARLRDREGERVLHLDLSSPGTRIRTEGLNRLEIDSPGFFRS